MSAIGVSEKNECWAEVKGQRVQVDCPDGILASTEKAAQRMEICRACSSYRAAIFMCGECNCLVPGKTRINISVCPLGKW